MHASIGNQVAVSDKTDIFAFGIVLVEVLTAIQIEPVVIRKHFDEEKLKESVNLLHHDLWFFIFMCLRRRQEFRPSAEQIERFFELANRTITHDSLITFVRICVSFFEPVHKAEFAQNGPEFKAFVNGFMTHLQNYLLWNFANNSQEYFRFRKVVEPFGVQLNYLSTTLGLNIQL